MTFALFILALWTLGLLFMFRVPVCRSSGAHRQRPTLSIIIPARNEESTLPILLTSLSVQDPLPEEIIVVDDGSEDRTAVVAREAGVRVLPSEPLPDGWRGKTWACFQGAEEATGKVLLFVDADTFFEQDGLHRIMDTYLDQRGVLSVGPYHKVRRVYEELSAFFNLIMTGGTGAFTVLGTMRQPTGLFGPFLMLDRHTYFQSGGHARVKDKILENLHLAAWFRRSGVPMRCYGGKGAVSMRMYPHGLRDLIEGWSKAFATGAASTPLPLLLLIIAWIAGSIEAIIYVVWAVLNGSVYSLVLSGVLYLCFALQIWFMLTRIGAFRLCTALLYPIPLLFYIVVFTRSSLLYKLNRGVSWKGRHVDTGPPGK